MAMAGRQPRHSGSAQASRGAFPGSRCARTHGVGVIEVVPGELARVLTHGRAPMGRVGCRARSPRWRVRRRGARRRPRRAPIRAERSRPPPGDQGRDAESSQDDEAEMANLGPVTRAAMPSAARTTRPTMANWPPRDGVLAGDQRRVGRWGLLDPRWRSGPAHRGGDLLGSGVRHALDAQIDSGLASSASTSSLRSMTASPATLGRSAHGERRRGPAVCGHVEPDSGRVVADFDAVEFDAGRAWAGADDPQATHRAGGKGRVVVGVDDAALGARQGRWSSVFP